MSLGDDDALIGCTGFVGSSLLRHAKFGAQFNSTTIETARGRAFRRVVCAAAPATMWAANRDPAGDRANLARLMAILETIAADEFVLISTIAVLDDASAGYTEATARYETAKAYGCHRHELELFVAGQFPRAHVLRLPALFGTGLKKNFLFDLLNPAPSFLVPERFARLESELSSAELGLVHSLYARDEGLGMWALDRARLAALPQRAELEAVLARVGLEARNFTNSASTFQYYGLHRLAADIDRTVAGGLPVLHVCPAPLEAATLAQRLTGRAFANDAAPLVREDMRSDHAARFSAAGPYLIDEAEVLADLDAFFAAERTA